jgi:hypothetical protein
VQGVEEVSKSLLTTGKRESIFQTLLNPKDQRLA